MNKMPDNSHFVFANTVSATGIPARLDLELDVNVARDLLIEALKQLTDHDGFSGSTTIRLTLAGKMQECKPLVAKVVAIDSEVKDV